ncbi:UNVERIFIED_CONTAM: hypothetical protein NCL1_26143 [Trichonephila clavipes]
MRSSNPYRKKRRTTESPGKGAILASAPHPRRTPFHAAVAGTRIAYTGRSPIRPSDRHEQYQGSRCTHAQSEEHRPRHSPRPLRGDHRPLRFRQVFAGVRHALRRGAAPLRRIAVGVCPPVPVADGKARCRSYRGPVAGDLDRAEVDLAQPALDRGHHHRDPRLPAPAVRPRRHPALPGSRRAAGGADRQPDGRSGAGAARRHGHHAAGAGGARTQGRTPARVRETAQRRLRARAHQRPGGRPGRCPGTGQAEEAHHRGGGRPHQGAPGPGPAPGGVVRDRAAHRRRHRLGRAHRRLGAGAGVLGPLQLPALRLLAERTGAAPVLLQQPGGRLPHLRRPGRAPVLRPEAPDQPAGAVAVRRRDPRLGPPQLLLLRHAGVAGRALRLRARRTLGVPAGEDAESAAAGLRRRAGRLHLHRRPRPPRHPRAPVRRHPGQPRAPLPRDRVQLGARGPGAIPQHCALR